MADLLLRPVNAFRELGMTLYILGDETAHGYDTALPLLCVFKGVLYQFAAQSLAFQARVDFCASEYRAVFLLGKRG